MKLLYEYNENGTFKCDKLVKSIDDVLIRTYEEKQIINGEEVIVELPLEKPRLIDGLTDVKPPSDMAIYPDVSPKLVDGVWVEVEDAVKVHLETLPKQKELMTHEQMDELLTFLAGGRA